MKKNEKIFVSVILILVLVSLAGCRLKQNNVNQLSENVNSVSTLRQDLGNGFFASIPQGWISEGSLNDAINIVKFGSLAHIETFAFAELGDDYFGPVITTSTFTIDERLDARDVANLIQDEKIADKLANSTKECFFEAKEFRLSGVNAFSYIHDDTDLTRCTGVATEPSVSKVVVLKNPGDNQAAVIELVTRNSEEYQKLLSDFQYILDNLQYR